MNFDRYLTAGVMLGLSIGIAAFTHGTRTARTTLDLAPQPLPQHQLRQVDQHSTPSSHPASGLLTGP
jgi:hypothetical protein